MVRILHGAVIKILQAVHSNFVEMEICDTTWHEALSALENTLDMMYLLSAVTGVGTYEYL